MIALSSCSMRNGPVAPKLGSTNYQQIQLNAVQLNREDTLEVANALVLCHRWQCGHRRHR